MSVAQLYAVAARHRRCSLLPARSTLQLTARALSSARCFARSAPALRAPLSARSLLAGGPTAGSTSTLARSEARLLTLHSQRLPSHATERGARRRRPPAARAFGGRMLAADLRARAPPACRDLASHPRRAATSWSCRARAVTAASWACSRGSRQHETSRRRRPHISHRAQDRAPRLSSAPSKTSQIAPTEARSRPQWRMLYQRPCRRRAASPTSAAAATALRLLPQAGGSQAA